MKVPTPGAFVARLSWPDVERRVRSGAVAVLPVGAASKEHGPHLPMGADLVQAEWLAEALARRARVLVWPAVPYGFYPAFVDYPGGVTLGQETFRTLVHEILSEICRAGVRAALVLNTGISTIRPLSAVAAEMSGDVRVGLANVYDGPAYRRMAAAIEEQPSGGHADELETSILMAIDPRCVAPELAQPWTPASMATPGPLSRSDPDAPRYCPTGVWGNPMLASEAKGRRLLDAMVEDLVAAVGSLQGGRVRARDPGSPSQ